MEEAIWLKDLYPCEQLKNRFLDIKFYDTPNTLFIHTVLLIKVYLLLDICTQCND